MREKTHEKTSEKVIAVRERCPYRYLLVREEGFYSLLVCGEGESCILTDIGREESRARAVLDRFAEGGVPPHTAREVAEELLARDPAVFV